MVQRLEQNLLEDYRVNCQANNISSLVTLRLSFAFGISSPFLLSRFYAPAARRHYEIVPARPFGRWKNVG